MRLLLAEDEEELSMALTAILRHSEYEVDAVFDGEEALAAAKENYYDGMIFDIMMPKKDGITLLKELREAGNVTPVLLLTAKAELDDRVLGLDAGADDYLTKPFAMTELLARIRAMLRHKENTMPDNLTFGNISLKRATMELLGKSSAIRLSAGEFELLELLIRNHDKDVSNKTILEMVWPSDEQADEDTVLIYVSYIRKKMEAVQADCAARDTADGGYRLELI